MHASTGSRTRHDASTASTATSLLSAAHRIGEVWRETTDDAARVDLAVAVTLTSHAALDALLPDETRSQRVRDSWRSGSVLVRAARVTGTLEQPLPADLEILCAIRHALGRSGEGTNVPFVRGWLEGDGVTRSLALLDVFRRLCRSSVR